MYIALRAVDYLVAKYLFFIVNSYYIKYSTDNAVYNYIRGLIYYYTYTFIPLRN